MTIKYIAKSLLSTILTKVYLEGLSDDAVIEITGYSNSQYYKLKGAAFLYFAEGYLKQIKKVQVFENRTVMRVTSEYNKTEEAVK